MGVDCMAVYNILHVKVRTGRKSANQLDTCSRCMTHNSTTNQKSRFSVLAIGAHNASMEGRRGGPTRVEAVRPITEARWPRTSRHPIIALHVIVASPHTFGRPSPPPTAGVHTLHAPRACPFQIFASSIPIFRMHSQPGWLVGCC